MNFLTLVLGNHYGTPKPSKESTSFFRSSEGLTFPGAHPSSEGKRRRNRSNVEAMTAKHVQQEDKDDLTHSNGNILLLCYSKNRNSKTITQKGKSHFRL